jgi:hypothetical protein
MSARIIRFVDREGDTHEVCIKLDASGVEREVGRTIRYTSVHGQNASVGHEWEASIIGEDIDDDVLGARTWYKSLEDCPEFSGDLETPSLYRVG